MGQTTGERVTLIEKTAAELILATECLAREHKDYRPPQSENLKMFFSVIVTTAKLTVAKFDPGVRISAIMDGHFSLIVDGETASSEMRWGSAQVLC